MVSVRLCWAHVSRVPATRGAGKKGSKGSLARHLIKMKYTGAELGKILGAVFRLNYIPNSLSVFDEQTGELTNSDFTHALTLLKEQFPKVFEDEQICKTYFSGKPRCLGGRCAGLPGQPGSTQGCKKRGGIMKEHHKRIVQFLSGPEKENPLYFLAAVATDLMLMPSVSSFAMAPSQMKEHLCLLREINKYNLSSTRLILLDALYLRNY